MRAGGSPELPVLPHRKQYSIYSSGLWRWSGGIAFSGGSFQGKFNDIWKGWMISRAYSDEKAGRKPCRTW